MNASVMDKRLFSLPSLGVTSAFPWGVNVAKIRHPKNGETVPGLLPTSPGGFLVSYVEGRTQEANLLIQNAVASILAQLPIQGANINVLDFSIKNQFSILSVLEASKIFKTHHFASDAMAYLEQVECLCVERHHNLLGSNFMTLSDYNQQATGPEPYTIIILNLNDFPTNAASIEKLSKVLSSAHEAGFYTILSCNISQEFSGADANKREQFLQFVREKYPELNLKHEIVETRIEIKDQHHASKDLLKVCSEHGLSIERPFVNPEEVNNLVQELQARELAPQKTGPIDFLTVPIGRTQDGRTELNFQLGDSEKTKSYHAFIIGSTGTGKSVLLNHLIMGVARKYTSKEICFWLIDFKEGTGFQRYKKHPNCEKLVLTNHNVPMVMDIIDKFKQQIEERGALFRKAGVENLTDYNLKNPKANLPYLVLVIDEFHKLSKMQGGSKAVDILEGVGREGRSFGLCMILATQTLQGSSREMQIMLSQFKQRVAFNIDNGDCVKFFNYKNIAATHLKNHHCVLNKSYGNVESNVICHVHRPPPREGAIPELESIAEQRGPDFVTMPEIFEDITHVGAEDPGNKTSTKTSANSKQDADVEGPEWLKKKPFASR